MLDLIATKDVDHGPGKPYEPRINTYGIYRTKKRWYGKCHFMTILGSQCSQSWLDDAKAKLESSHQSTGVPNAIR